MKYFIGLFILFLLLRGRFDVYRGFAASAAQTGAGTAVGAGGAKGANATDIPSWWPAWLSGVGVNFHTGK
jgi:hypothetical protein